MKARLPLLMSLALAAALPATAAEVPEVVKTAASATEKGLKTAEAAVVRGAKAAASGTRYGMEKASDAVNSTAKRLGVPSGPATSSSSGLPAKKKEH